MNTLNTLRWIFFTRSFLCGFRTCRDSAHFSIHTFCFCHFQHHHLPATTSCGPLLFGCYYALLSLQRTRKLWDLPSYLPSNHALGKKRLNPRRRWLPNPPPRHRQERPSQRTRNVRNLSTASHTSQRSSNTTTELSLSLVNLGERDKRLILVSKRGNWEEIWETCRWRAVFCEWFHLDSNGKKI